MTLGAHIAEQARRVDRTPTDPQKEAGNYRKGHVRIHGMEIAIENPRGSFRSGIGEDGKPWRARLPAHYGYIKRTEGADGDHVDVFVGPHHRSSIVYVVDQNDADSGRFDEHKAFIGFASPKQVRSAYHDAFTDGRAKDRLGHLTEMTVNQFKTWLAVGDMKRPLHRADGGRIAMAGGGAPEFDPSKPFDAAPAPAFDPAKPFETIGGAPAKPDFSWSQAVTDIPSEIGKEASSAAGDLAHLSGIGGRGPIESLMDTGKAALAVPRLALSPLTGATRSLLGHGMANTEHAIGTVINPKVAAQDNPEAMYETAKGDADKAMSALAARRSIASVAAPNVPLPTTIGDFGVPLTEGEAAADASRIAAEQRALRGGEGAPAQRVAQARLDARNAQLKDVRGDVSRMLDPYGGQVAETPAEAAELAQRGVQETAENLRDLSRQRYAEMRDLPGEFHAGAFEGIGQRIRGQLTLGDNPVIVDDRTTPMASQMLRDVDEQIGSLRIQNRADPFGQPNPENITAVNLQGVDQARKRLVKLYQDARTYPPTADTRAARAILGAFDDQVENSITQGLFSGDERALDALREARGAYSTYRRLFTSQGSGDDVGRAMQHIVGTPNREAATPTEIANYLYGTANVGAKGLSYRLAQRLRDVLGEQSPEWAGIKQGLWRRLTETPEGVADWGPQRVSTNINKFLNGDGQPLANRVFNDQERQLMQRYANLQQRMVPPPGTVNYSNNLQWAAQFRDSAVKYISAFIGEKLGGPLGAVVGYGLGHATQPIMDVAKARKVAQSMPTIAESMDRWDRAVRIANRRGLPSTPALSAATSNLLTKMQQTGIDVSSLLRQMQGPLPAGADNDRKRRVGGRTMRRPFDDGGTVSPLDPRNEVASMPLTNPIAEGLARQIATPGLIMKPNPYPPGSEEASWYDDQRAKAMTDWAPGMAINTMGIGAIAGVPVRASEIALGAGYVRRTRGVNPDNGTGHMMFVAEPKAHTVEGYGPNEWHFESNDVPPAEIIDAGAPRFRASAYKALRRSGEDRETSRALVDEANPASIVDSAGLWDNLGYTETLWNRYLEPLGIKAVTTNEGAIVFDPKLVRPAR